MAARAMWKGQLRLSLVSIPVELFSATRSGARYVLLDPEEVDAIKLETKKTLELVHFVDVGEIPPLYFDKPYYLVPADELAEDAYRVVRDALRTSNKTGTGQLTLRGREYLVAVKPCGDGLLLETLRYPDEFRKADKELLEVAAALLERKTAPCDADAFKDNYASALRELVKRKMEGKSARVEVDEGDRPERRGDNVVDLMAALKKSLEGNEPKKAKAPSSSRRSRRKSA
ncbi:Ku protein [Sinorhizobium sp. BJ1]|uniref:non-homologous end joining protein Ku n=1 Tax=Sinorhizobium sp. BJ1 TaxID=2035455 RepID=UPI000BEA18D8|nr:Ku protein [Sinorhizobium sp. BJ1]PDT82884.1 Ku protein [Sinorhizobium sp. BJ1]